MPKKQSKNGFSLIELLLAMAIFLLIFLGASYLLLDNLNSSYDNQERIKAEFLAQEGMEAAKALAFHNWPAFKPGQYGLTLVDNSWQLVDQPQTVDLLAKPGQRIISIDDVPANQNLKKIESKVIWLSINDKPKESTITTFVSNWNNYISQCSDGLDNDNDGTIDYLDDPGCDSALDDDEFNLPSPPPTPPVCIDNDKDGYNLSQPDCGVADCDDANLSVHPGAIEICQNNIDDNCDGLTDCQDFSCTTDPNCQTVLPNIVFNDQENGTCQVCKLEAGTINVTGTVTLPVGMQARLQLFYYTANPADLRTDIIYVDKGIVENGTAFSLEVPWPGVRPNEKMVQVHIGARLLDLTTGNPLMANPVSLDYFWYPWVCSAPPIVGNCLDNDADTYLAPGAGCVPTATVQTNGNIKAPKGKLRLEVMASQITYGAGGPEVFVKVGLKLNQQLNWLFNSQDVDGGEKYETTLNVDTNIALRGNAWYQTTFNRTLDSDGGTPYVKVLLKGDNLPNVPRFGSQQPLSEIIGPFVDQNRKINIDINQVLLIFELGTTDLNSSAADFQDLVVLLTFTPDTQAVCNCGAFDCNDNNANINPGATEICNNLDDNCNFIADEGCP